MRLTIIVCRDGVMAADTMVTKGSMRYGECEKIKRLPDGSLFAAAGSGDECHAVAAWLADGRPEVGKPTVTKDDGWRGILLRPGAPFPLEMGASLVEREMRVPYAVVGDQSAENICAGALARGATAAEAVQIAIDNCVWVGGKVQVETL